MRFKVPYGVASCLACYEPNLSTDGTRVICKCGDESHVRQWGKALRIFARRVRKEMRRAG